MAMGPGGDGIWSAVEYERCYRAGELSGLSRALYRALGDGVDEKRFWRNVYDQRIVPAFGQITGAQRILVVGCGLGLLIEHVASTGFANIWGIDGSSYVESQWDIPHARLARLDIRTATDQQLRTLTGGTLFDWVITESVMECYPPAEQAAMYAACEARLSRNTPLSHCVHLVYPDTDMTRWPAGAQIPQPDGSAIPEVWAGQLMDNPGCPARTLGEWQASRPLHTFLSMVGV